MTSFFYLFLRSSENNIHAQVDPGLFPIAEIEFKVQADIPGKMVGSTEDKRTGEKSVGAFCLLRYSICRILYGRFKAFNYRATAKTDTGIYFPFGNQHIQTIGGP